MRERLIGLVLMASILLILGVGYYAAIVVTIESGDLLCATLLGIVIGFPLGLTYAEIRNPLTLRSAKKKLRNELRKLIEMEAENK